MYDVQTSVLLSEPSAIFGLPSSLKDSLIYLNLGIRPEIIAIQAQLICRPAMFDWGLDVHDIVCDHDWMVIITCWYCR